MPTRRTPFNSRTAASRDRLSRAASSSSDDDEADYSAPPSGSSEALLSTAVWRAVLDQYHGEGDIAPPTPSTPVPDAAPEAAREDIRSRSQSRSSSRQGSHNSRHRATAVRKENYGSAAASSRTKGAYLHAPPSSASGAIAAALEENQREIDQAVSRAEARSRRASAMVQVAEVTGESSGATADEELAVAMRLSGLVAWRADDAMTTSERLAAELRRINRHSRVAIQPISVPDALNRVWGPRLNLVPQKSVMSVASRPVLRGASVLARSWWWYAVLFAFTLLAVVLTSLSQTESNHPLIASIEGMTVVLFLAHILTACSVGLLAAVLSSFDFFFVIAAATILGLCDITHDHFPPGYIPPRIGLLIITLAAVLLADAIQPPLTGRWKKAAIFGAAAAFALTLNLMWRLLKCKRTPCEEVSLRVVVVHIQVAALWASGSMLTYLIKFLYRIVVKRREVAVVVTGNTLSRPTTAAIDVKTYLVALNRCISGSNGSYRGNADHEVNDDNEDGKTPLMNVDESDVHSIDEWMMANICAVVPISGVGACEVTFDEARQAVLAHSSLRFSDVVVDTTVLPSAVIKRTIESQRVLVPETLVYSLSARPIVPWTRMYRVVTSAPFVITYAVIVLGVFASIFGFDYRGVKATWLNLAVRALAIAMHVVAWLGMASRDVLFRVTVRALEFWFVIAQLAIAAFASYGYYHEQFGPEVAVAHIVLMATTGAVTASLDAMYSRTRQERIVRGLLLLAMSCLCASQCYMYQRDVDDNRKYAAHTVNLVFVNVTRPSIGQVTSFSLAVMLLRFSFQLLCLGQQFVFLPFMLREA